SLLASPTLLALAPRRPSPTLFPYTTLFRSAPGHQAGERARRRGARWGEPGRRRRQGRRLRAGPGGRGERRRGRRAPAGDRRVRRSEEHTSELQSPCNLVCRLLLEKKKTHHV